MSPVARLESLYKDFGFWTDEAAAVAIVETASGPMIGTLQCYRSAPAFMVSISATSSTTQTAAGMATQLARKDRLQEKTSHNGAS